MKESIYEHLQRTGKTIEAVAAELGKSGTTLHNALKREPIRDIWLEVDRNNSITYAWYEVPYYDR